MALDGFRSKEDGATVQEGQFGGGAVSHFNVLSVFENKRRALEISSRMLILLHLLH